MSLADRLKQLLGNPQQGQENNLGPDGKPKQDSKPANSQVQVIQQNMKDPNNKAALEGDALYQSIWGTEPAAQPGTKNLFNTDPEKFGKAVADMDFAKSIPKEMLEKALGGDMQTLMAVINRVGQNAFSTATISSREMIEHANRTQGGSLQSQINEAVRAALAQQNVASRNESFTDPTVAPLLQELSGRLRAKFPEASAEELGKHAESMLMSIATKIVSGSPAEKARQKQQQEVKKSEVFDWEAWGTTNPGQSAPQQTDFDAAQLFSNGGNSGGSGNTMQ